MTDQEEHKRLVLRTVLATFTAVAGVAFGTILLVVDHDWIPGSIIVVAALVGLAAQASVIRRLRSDGRPPSPPRHKPAH